MSEDKGASRNRLMHMARTMLVTGMAYVVNYGITLVLTPFITQTVGTEAYGFVTLAKQFTQYAVIVTTALNIYAARYIALSYHKGDMDQANRYFASVFWGDVYLGFALLALALLITFFLERLISVPAALVSDVKLLFVFSFIAFWVTTVFSVFLKSSSSLIASIWELKNSSACSSWSVRTPYSLIHSALPKGSDS